MKGFIQQTVLSIVKQHGWQDMRDLTIVFPSHRAGLVWKNELRHIQLSEHRPPIFLPDITTLSELFDRFSPLYKEEELLLIFRLYHIYKEITRETISLDIFYGWGRQLIADFDNIDKSVGPEGVEPFFQNSIEAKQLEEVVLDEETRQRLEDLIYEGAHTDVSNSIRWKFRVLWEHMYSIYQRFNEELRHEKKGYEGARMRSVITHWQDLAQHYQGRQFIFVGFNYLMPVEKEFMTLLHKQGQARFYWDYVESFEVNKKAFSFIQEHIQVFGNEAQQYQWNSPRKISLISATTIHAQAQYAGQWLREHYTHMGQSTAIVICDEQMLEPVIYALPAVRLEGQSRPEAINITKGFPLSSTQIYSEVVSYLSDSHNDLREGETYLHVLDRLIEDVIVPDERMAKQQKKKNNPQEEFDNEENTWQWLLIQESLYQTRRIIQQFRQALATSGLLSEVNRLSLLRSLLRRCLEGTSLPFHGEPITDIQVMGVLETRMLDFDNLLLINVEEGVVPKQTTDISFIPYYLRKSYHMQTRDESASVYAYNFFRLLSRAGNITMLFSEADTAMGRKSMSRFLMQIMVSPRYFEVQKAVLTESNYLKPIVLQDAVVAPIPFVSKLEKHQDGMLYYRSNPRKRYTLSPSALGSFISCRRQFYLRYVLGIQEVQPETCIFASNTLGSFVHSGMEYIYKKYGGCTNTQPQTIQPEMLQTILDNKHQEMQQILEAAYQAQNIAYAKQHPSADIIKPHYILDEHRLENIIIEEYIRNILRRDLADAKQGLQICLLESNQTFPICIDDEIGTIDVGGVVDRLDICNGVMRVIDYKTGRYNKDKVKTYRVSLFQKPDARYVLQTLIYCEAATYNLPASRDKLPIQPHLYFTQKNLEKLHTCLQFNDEPISDYLSERERFLSMLQEKVCELLTTTDFPQCNEKECSEMCAFRELCGRPRTDK